MWSAIAAIITSHSLAARIDIFGFLIPHATKVILWSFVALVWLRPRFGWRYPFAMVLLYASAEMVTNTVYVGAHYQNLAQVLATGVGTSGYIQFGLAQAFFGLAIILCYLFLKGHFEWHRDWSMLPFIVFVGYWVVSGYQTESTIAFPSYWLEAEEFLWNVFYLIMVTQGVFRAKLHV